MLSIARFTFSFSSLRVLGEEAGEEGEEEGRLFISAILAAV